MFTGELLENAELLVKFGFCASLRDDLDEILDEAEGDEINDDAFWVFLNGVMNDAGLDRASPQDCISHYDYSGDGDLFVSRRGSVIVEIVHDGESIESVKLLTPVYDEKEGYLYFREADRLTDADLHYLYSVQS